MEKLIHLCNRRGFVYSGSKIYGGLRGSFDYGPLGVQLKKNISDLWWNDFVEQRPDCVGLDSSIILHPKVWETSGHINEFTDPLASAVCARNVPGPTSCWRTSHRCPRTRSPKCLWKNADGPFGPQRTLPACNSPAEESFTGDVQHFNMLFTTSLGPTESIQNDNTVYLRPETAQGAYINFSQIVKSLRKRVPFGIGQIGKAFRNEIHPSNFLFRTREFELLELQYFTHPENATKEYERWREYCFAWLRKYGIDDQNLRFRDYGIDEVAHYARATTDNEYNFPSLGWSELWGIADRGDFDLKQHIRGTSGDEGSSGSKKKKKKRKRKSNSSVGTYVDPSTNESYVPYIIEPALGLNRAMLAFLCDAWVEGQGSAGEGDERMYLRLHEDIAPYKCAVR